MERIVDVTGGQGGNAFLVLGKEKTALVDCGMAYCAPQLIHNLIQILNQKTLDYICISHSHYDHIGAIPYLKKEWPNSQVLGAEYAKRILDRQNALNTIRALGQQAAKLYGAGDIAPYEDDNMKVDVVVSDGDILDLGHSRIKVLETPGHTKCSLSFLIDNEILFASESTGYMSKSGKVYPAFITSCSEAIRSIQICQEINPRFIISPHFGLVSESDTPHYWEACITAVKETKEFILHLNEQGYDEEQILVQYEKEFRDEESRLEQPLNAFKLNVQSMIKTVLSEKC